MSLEKMDSGSGFLPSLWWSFTTLVTGGYADIHDPETGLGKILTVLLVLTGMILVGVFTATLTSVLVSDDDSLKIEEIEEQTELITGINDNVKRVDDRLNKLESAIHEINESIKSNGQQSDK
jgi:peptidoglycan hydrolase CwlO-like protein